jgi:hypothetical protein
MPAESKAQRHFFAGWEHNPDKMKGKKPDMTRGQMHDFAATKTKDLPNWKRPNK